jgi:hypothetical protein
MFLLKTKNYILSSTDFKKLLSYSQEVDKSSYAQIHEAMFKIMQLSNSSDKIKVKELDVIISSMENYLTTNSDGHVADILSQFYYLYACYNRDSNIIAENSYFQALNVQCFAYLIYPTLKRLYEISMCKLFLGQFYERIGEKVKARNEYTTSLNLIKFVIDEGFSEGVVEDDMWVVYESVQRLSF